MNSVPVCCLHNLTNGFNLSGGHVVVNVYINHDNTCLSKSICFSILILLILFLVLVASKLKKKMTLTPIPMSILCICSVHNVTVIYFFSFPNYSMSREV